MVVGRLLSYWEGKFSGVTIAWCISYLNFGRVTIWRCISYCKRGFPLRCYNFRCPITWEISFRIPVDLLGQKNRVMFFFSWKGRDGQGLSIQSSSSEPIQNTRKHTNKNRQTLLQGGTPLVINGVYSHYKWPYKWVAGVGRTPFITSRGPPCRKSWVDSAVVFHFLCYTVTLIPDSSIHRIHGTILCSPAWMVEFSCTCREIHHTWILWGIVECTTGLY